MRFFTIDIQIAGGGIIAPYPLVTIRILKLNSPLMLRLHFKDLYRRIIDIYVSHLHDIQILIEFGVHEYRSTSPTLKRAVGIIYIF